jgi:hypothetical protein
MKYIIAAAALCCVLGMNPAWAIEECQVSRTWPEDPDTPLNFSAWGFTLAPGAVGPHGFHPAGHGPDTNPNGNAGCMIVITGRPARSDAASWLMMDLSPSMPGNNDFRLSLHESRPTIGGSALQRNAPVANTPSNELAFWSLDHSGAGGNVGALRLSLLPWESRVRIDQVLNGTVQKSDYFVYSSTSPGLPCAEISMQGVQRYGGMEWTVSLSCPQSSMRRQTATVYFENLLHNKAYIGLLNENAVDGDFSFSLLLD